MYICSKIAAHYDNWRNNKATNGRSIHRNDDDDGHAKIETFQIVIHEDYYGVCSIGLKVRRMKCWKRDKQRAVEDAKQRVEHN